MWCLKSNVGDSLISFSFLAVKMKNMERKKKQVATDNLVTSVVVWHCDIRTKICQACVTRSHKSWLTHTQSHCVNTFRALLSLAHSRTQETWKLHAQYSDLSELFKRQVRLGVCGEMKMGKIRTCKYYKHLNKKFISCLVRSNFDIDLNFENLSYLFPKEDAKQCGQLVILRKAEASQNPYCNWIRSLGISL